MKTEIAPSEPVEVALVGCGSLAHHLAAALKGSSTLRLRWVVGTSAEKASAFIDRVGLEAQPATTPDSMSADLFLLAVPDSTIPQLSQQIASSHPDATQLHFSGATPLYVLARHTAHAGVFYPLQTFRPQRRLSWEEIPVFYEAADDHALNAIHLLATALGVRKLTPLDSDTRLKLHLVAVFVSNFTNHLFSVAYRLCGNYGLEWGWFFPLIRETFNRILEEEYPPAHWQTGPALRGDLPTIVRHLQSLEPMPYARLLYSVLSDSIRHFHETQPAHDAGSPHD